MPERSILSQLRELSAQKKLDSDVALSLLCGATAELFDKVNLLLSKDLDFRRDLVSQEGSLQKLSDQLQETLCSVTDHVSSLRSSIDHDVDGLREDLEKIKENPFVRFGDWMDKNPKLFWAFVLVLVLLSNLWFISSFREGILLWLKVPEPIIELFLSSSCTCQ